MLFRSGLALIVHAGKMNVEYSPTGTQGSDAIRTRCPGPALGTHPLASAVVPLSELGHRRFTLTLDGGVRLDDHAYRIRTASTLSFALKRTNVRQQVYRIGVPS